MSDRFEALVAAVPGARERSYQRARRYVAGATLDEALDVARDLLRQGLGVSLDAFGELVRDPAEAAQAAGAYAALIDAAAALDGDVWVSVDLSHIGLDVSPAFCATQLRRITERLPAGMRLQVGAEDAARCDAILDIVEEAAGRGDALTCTLQANLRRSMADTARVASFGMPVRLVKGAFVEPAAVAYPYGPETDTSYVLLARALRRARHRGAVRPRTTRSCAPRWPRRTSRCCSACTPRRRPRPHARAPACESTHRTERCGSATSCVASPRRRARDDPEVTVIAVDHHDGVAVVRLEHGKVNVLDLELLQALSADARRPARRRRDRAHGRRPRVLRRRRPEAAAGRQRRRHGGVPARARRRPARALRLPASGRRGGERARDRRRLHPRRGLRLPLMSGGTIGVAELKVGVPFPTAPFEILRNAVGPRTAALVLTGRTVGPEEALAIGLVDETQAPEHLLDRSLDRRLACWRGFRGRRSPTPASSCAATRDGASKRAREADRATRALLAIGRDPRRRPWLPRRARSAMSDLETRVCDAIAEGRDDLVQLVTDLVAFDTTARSTGDPPRQEADLQRYLGDRLGARGATVDIWEPAAVRRRRLAPGRRRAGVRRPAAAGRHPGRRRRRQVAAAERPHRRRHARPGRPLGERSVARRDPRRQPLRPRHVRHEGRHRQHGVRRRDPRAARRPAGRRPRRLHEHRRGVVRRRRHRLRAARRARRCGHLHRADRVRGVDVQPRLADAGRHRRGPARARRADRSRTGARAAR